MRMTISVPEDLKQRMDSVDEKVNWSAVACEGFRARLLKIAASKPTTTMSAVIERLRASKEASRKELNSEAEEEGYQWAKEEAETAHLERLADHDGRGKEFSEKHPDGEFYGVIEPDTNPRFFDQECNQFWIGVLGENRLHKAGEPDYVEGFAKGALKLWDEVRQHI